MPRTGEFRGRAEVSRANAVAVGAVGLDMNLTTTSDSVQRRTPSGNSNEIEIGLIVAGLLDDVDTRALQRAVDILREFLSSHFPEQHFSFFTVRRPELTDGGRIEPSVLLQQATEDRDSQHWDFSFVLTSAELVGNYSPFCFAALSRPLDAAVISMSLIDPEASGVDTSETVRIERIAKRVSRLFLHALGHLLGLPQDDRSDHLLYRPAAASDLDQMTEVDAAQLERQRDALAEIADQRLEEGSGRSLRYPAFAARAAWINRREIVEAIAAARPWEFPKRLSRLTLASVSTVAILLMTAEAWDLALMQSWTRVLGLQVLALVITTGYVIKRQQLLLRRNRQRTEQTVVTTISALGIVLTGMAVTWIALVILAAAVGMTLFDDRLIASWAASSHLQESSITEVAPLRMACFSASVGLLIGALGASFESQHYFRHVIFVDEEI